MRDLKGVVFKRVTVIGYHGKNKWNRPLWDCVCECGKTFTTSDNNLLMGHTTSCGCLGAENRKKSRLIHGRSHKNDSEYETWKGMKARCSNPRHEHYKYYGGKGIKVCTEWANDFLVFLKDMGEKPSIKHSVEREDTNGDYCPSNCRWDVIAVQSRNKSTGRRLTFEGKTMVLEDWASFFGVNQSTLHEHLEKKTFEQVNQFYLDKKSKMSK